MAEEPFTYTPTQEERETRDRVNQRIEKSRKRVEHSLAACEMAQEMSIWSHPTRTFDPRRLPIRRLRIGTQ
jgi:hypothetical protein